MIFCQYENAVEVSAEVVLFVWIFEAVSTRGSRSEVNAIWSARFRKQVSSNTTGASCAKNLNLSQSTRRISQTTLSPLRQSPRLRPNSTCHMTLKCHNHWDVCWSLRCPGSEDRSEDEGRVIVSLSSRSPWLAHARPNYRSWCWRRVTLRVPAVC